MTFLLDSANKLLAQLNEKGELSLSEVSDLLPRKFNDHRDYYLLANLITSGYVGFYILSQDEPFDSLPDIEIARLLFVWNQCETKVEYDG